MVADHVTEMRKRNSDLDSKLSPGTYAYNEIRNILALIVGYGGGWFAGGFIGGFFDKNKYTNMLWFCITDGTVRRTLFYC